MPSSDSKVGKTLRFLASGGYAEEDAETVRELLEQAAALAHSVVADAGASGETRAAARRLLDELHTETYERYD